jgi:hypothetical protein
MCKRYSARYRPAAWCECSARVAATRVVAEVGSERCSENIGLENLLAALSAADRREL